MNKWLEEREHNAVAVAVLLLVVQGLGSKPNRMQPLRLPRRGLFWRCKKEVLQKQDQQPGTLGKWECMGDPSPTRLADPQRMFVTGNLVLYCDVAVVQNTGANYRVFVVRTDGAKYSVFVGAQVCGCT
jgi:hypothetical protein